MAVTDVNESFPCAAPVKQHKESIGIKQPQIDDEASSFLDFRQNSEGGSRAITASDYLKFVPPSLEVT